MRFILLTAPLFIFTFIFFFSSNIVAETPSPSITPLENFMIDGIPAIPDTIAQEAGPYIEYRTALMMDWHPQKKKLLIITRFGAVPQVHQVSFPGGPREQITFSKDRVAEATFEPKYGNYLIFNSDTGGNERYQNYRFDIKTKKVTLLTDGTSKNHLGIWSHQGDQMAFGSTRRNGKDIDIYIIKPNEPSPVASTRLLAELNEGESWEVLDWSPDDSKLLALERKSASESVLWIINSQNGEKTLITPPLSPKLSPNISPTSQSYKSAQFSHDGRGVFVTTDKDSEFMRLAYIDLQTKEYNQTYYTTHIPWNIESFAIFNGDSNNTIAFVSNENGISVLHLLDTKTHEDQVIQNKDLPIGVIYNLVWHQKEKLLAFSVSSAQSPMDVFSFDPKTKKVKRWTKSESSGIDLNKLAIPKLITWNSFDQLPISGFLYTPPKTSSLKKVTTTIAITKSPVIIVIHGGPESQARPGFIGKFNYYLNELGVAVIFPNIRGSTGYGKKFLDLDNGYLRENSYKDIGALLDWIKTRPELDADRIMVVGTSYGGHMTLATSYLYSDKIRCAVDIVGISNFVSFLENTEDYRKDLRRVKYGDERDPKMRAFLEKIAPLNNVDKIKKPIFVVQGLNDPRVRFSESQQMVEALKKNKVPVWYLVAKDEGHGFIKKENQRFEFFSTILFVKKYLF